MGFSTLIDILGSSIIGGLLLLTLLRLNDQSVKNTYTFGGDLQVQENLTTLVKSIEFDFKNIGYCKKPFEISKLKNNIILYADSVKIRYNTDLISNSYPEGDGTIDLMEYHYDINTDIPETPNPKDRFLHRVINGTKDTPVNLGITHFRIQYFDFNGIKLNSPVSDPSQIYTMQIDMQVENTSAYDNEYSTTFWRQIRLVAPIIKQIN